MAAQSTEEVWNMKEYVRRVALACADLQAHPPSFILDRVGHLNEGFQAKLGDRPLATLLREFHAPLFNVADAEEEGGEPLISLTEAGARKFLPNAPDEDELTQPSDAMAQQVRDNVFAELAAAGRQRQAGSTE